MAKIHTINWKIFFSFRAFDKSLWREDIGSGMYNNFHTFQNRFKCCFFLSAFYHFTFIIAYAYCFSYIFLFLRNRTDVLRWTKRKKKTAEAVVSKISKSYAFVFHNFSWIPKIYRQWEYFIWFNIQMIDNNVKTFETFY